MLTSKSNELVRLIKSLSERKFRARYNMFPMEGAKFVADSVQSGIKAKYLIISEGCSLNIPMGFSAQEVRVSEDIFNYLSCEKSPQGIMGVYEIPVYSDKDILSCDKLLLLDRIQNPENAGALVRSAVCAGFEGIVNINDGADIYAPRAVQASAGSVMFIKHKRCSVDYLSELKGNGFCLYAGALEGEENINIDEKKIAIVIGNEGSGISQQVKAYCDRLVKIPIPGKCESLNAVVAGSLLMYKAIGYFGGGDK